MKQFEAVNCRYGAPMGRAEYGILENCNNKSISVFRVNIIDGGYDDGGAYWGVCTEATIIAWGRIGALYCARTDDDTYRQFVRASSRQEAITELGIPARLLKRA